MLEKARKCNPVTMWGEWLRNWTMVVGLESPIYVKQKSLLEKENQNVLAFKHPPSSDVYDTTVSDIVSKLKLKFVTKTLYYFDKDYFKSLLVR